MSSFWVMLVSHKTGRPKKWTPEVIEALLFDYMVLRDLGIPAKAARAQVIEYPRWKRLGATEQGVRRLLKPDRDLRYLR